ncbi:MAG: hypothetical protein WA364_10575 [Candidatus Nitrosopolaris sp.]
MLSLPHTPLSEPFQAEKEALRREIDERRAILDGTTVDVQSRRKLVEEYQMKAEIHRHGIAIGPEDLKGFSRLIQTLQRGNSSAAKIWPASAD